MGDEVEELLGFLSSPSPQLKKAALGIVRDLTGSDGGIDSLALRSDIALPPLCRLLRDPLEVSSPAAESLINLSQNPALAEKLVLLGVVDMAMEAIYKQGGSDARLCKLLVMLLVNLTQMDSGIASLLQIGNDKMEGLYLSKLVRSFCRSSSTDTDEDPYEHIASIIVNVSKMEAGRMILLQPKGSLMKQIIRQADSANPLRKKGVYGIIRNCCFEADRQMQNLLLLSEFLWPALLLPAAGKMKSKGTMLFSRKDLVRANITLAQFCLEVLLVKRCSISSLTKFSTQEENDTFWLKQLSRKDWLAPKEVLKVFKNLRDIELVMDALSKASARLDYKPSETLYSLLIDRFSHELKFDVISDLLDRANSEKIQLSNKFFHRVINIYGNLANCPELAIGTLYRMPEFQCWPSVKTFNYVLNLLVCTNRFEKIHEVFLSASSLGVLPDTCCFNILIKGLCRLNKLEASFSVLHEISEQGLHPSATTYSMLMHSLCKHGRLKEAFEVDEMMEKESCHPDSVTFNILISGLCEDGKVGDGMGLLKTMQLKGCCPDAGTYQALLYGMLKDKRFVDAKNFMCKMISERRYPSFLSYKMTIEGLCSERLVHDVDSVLRQMVS